MAKKKKDVPGELLVCRNPKATKTYVIEERLEAGMVLTGSEGKSLRQQSLLANGFTTRTEFDTAEKTLSAAQSSLDTAKADLTNAEKDLSDTVLRADAHSSAVAKTSSTRITMR